MTTSALITHHNGMTPYEEGRIARILYERTGVMAENPYRNFANNFHAWQYGWDSIGTEEGPKQINPTSELIQLN